MFLFVVYALIFVPLVFIAWARHRDVFHPWMYLIPQCVFLNAALPLAVFMLDRRNFMFFVGPDFLTTYQFLTIGLTACLVVGSAIGAAGAMPRWAELKWKGAIPLLPAAFAIGAIGFAAFAYGVWNAGGILDAYGRAYGGGTVASGYIREARFTGVIGVLMVYALKAKRGLTLQDWAVIALCIFPTLFHGLVGARRGPTFLALVVLVGGYLFFSRKKIGFAMAIPGVLLVGLGLLFLVANRNSIYLGTSIEDASEFRSPLSYLDRWNSNEYLFGSAVVRYANEDGSYYGTRELVHLIGRIVPNAVWPNEYEDLTQMMGIKTDLTVNDGIDSESLMVLNGWTPSFGAAPGFVGDLWLEFGYLSFLVTFLIGYLYGWTWKKTATAASARLIYLLLVALSVYLIMQGLDPWLYRVLLLGVVALLVVKNFSVRRTIVARRRIGDLRHPVPGPGAGVPGR
jgi:oligosaccharide repeat unit polymerase